MPNLLRYGSAGATRRGGRERLQEDKAMVAGNKYLARWGGRRASITAKAHASAPNVRGWPPHPRRLSK